MENTMTEPEADLATEVRAMRRSIDALVIALQPPPEDENEGDPVANLAEALADVARAIVSQSERIDLLAHDIRAVRMTLSVTPLPVAA